MAISTGMRVCLVAALSSFPLVAQEREESPRGFGALREEILERFDRNENGRLDPGEREALIERLRERREEVVQRGGRGQGSRGREDMERFRERRRGEIRGRRPMAGVAPGREALPMRRLMALRWRFLRERMEAMDGPRHSERRAEGRRAGREMPRWRHKDRAEDRRQGREAVRREDRPEGRSEGRREGGGDRRGEARREGAEEVRAPKSVDKNLEAEVAELRRVVRELRSELGQLRDEAPRPGGQMERARAERLEQIERARRARAPRDEGKPEKKTSSDASEI